MSSSYIELENISYSYEDKNIFEHFNLKLKEGETTVIMAPSGNGKTTLLHLLAGLLKPQNGNILFPIPNPRISMVFQENRLLESARVFQNIKLVNQALTKEEILSLLQSLNLSDCYLKKAGHLSGGQARRLTIARALACQYDILLLDEPFTGLDEETKWKVMNFLKERTKGKTVLLVTHNKEEAEFFSCNKINLSNFQKSAII